MNNLFYALGAALGLFGIAAVAVIGLLWIVAIAVRSVFSEKDEPARTKEGGRICEISSKA